MSLPGQTPITITDDIRYSVSYQHATEDAAACSDEHIHVIAQLFMSQLDTTNASLRGTVDAWRDESDRRRDWTDR